MTGEVVEPALDGLCDGLCCECVVAGDTTSAATSAMDTDRIVADCTVNETLPGEAKRPQPYRVRCVLLPTRSALKVARRAGGGQCSREHCEIAEFCAVARGGDGGAHRRPEAPAVLRPAVGSARPRGVRPRSAVLRERGERGLRRSRGGRASRTAPTRELDAPRRRVGRREERVAVEG